MKDHEKEILLCGADGAALNQYYPVIKNVPYSSRRPPSGQKLTSCRPSSPSATELGTTGSQKAASDVEPKGYAMNSKLTKRWGLDHSNALAQDLSLNNMSERDKSEPLPKFDQIPSIAHSNDEGTENSNSNRNQSVNISTSAEMSYHSNIYKNTAAAAPNASCDLEWQAIQEGLKELGQYLVKEPIPHAQDPGRQLMHGLDKGLCTMLLAVTFLQDNPERLHTLGSEFALSPLTQSLLLKASSPVMFAMMHPRTSTEGVNH
eukprot:CAMPEP_0196571662 /NCGR_PEP_ID=MMETSP1081-20130531/1810_1 /TAXON_ID=36882 /ORGANISM="Pyramimonas amylifera, Strain CCMP720" /LENGTH=260 /DNA_ID=CAMNT_0041888693 /DNA_START=374 /DNA_END=1156 /DNA_ORIENTATION=+